MIKNLISKKNSSEKLVDNKITLMIIILIFLLILNKFPLFILNMWYAMYSSSSFNNIIFHILSSIGALFILLNTLMNFLLSWFFNKKFREILLQIIYRNYTKRSKIQIRTFQQNQLPLQIRD